MSRFGDNHPLKKRGRPYPEIHRKYLLIAVMHFIDEEHYLLIH